MGRYTGKTCRLLVMLTLTSGFFLAEIITGYITNYIALIADSFHMLSDVIALIVGFAAVRMSTKSTSKNTFGWQRAEVVGALVNSVFLIALCFTIVVEALQRFAEKIEPITNKELNFVLYVGSLGLAVNGFGLFLFSSHGMSHGHSHGGGGHGHSHGGGGHGHSKKPKSDQHRKSPTISKKRSDLEVVIQAVKPESHNVDNSVAIEMGHDNLEESNIHLTIDQPTEVDTETEPQKEQQQNSAAQLNMRGVFLHVLGDALGSVVVIVSALIIKYTKGDWRFYMDPAMSLVIVVIIITTTIPLFKQSSMILLQSLPRDVNIFDIENRLVSKVTGIENIHEFHVWQLSGNKIIATAHIRFRNINDYVQAAQEMKSFLHEEGIHSTTIQPEFSEVMTDSSNDKLSSCMLMCQPEVCRPMTCCGGKEGKPAKQILSSLEDKDASSCQIATQTVETELDWPSPNKELGADTKF